MRIAIDWDLCIGSGLCVAAARPAFALTPYAGAQRAVLVDASCDDEALLAAARACPTLAIRLWDSDGQAIYPDRP